MPSRILGTRARALLVAASLLLAAVSALAFTPVSQNDLYEIRLPQHRFLTAQTYGRDVGMLQTAQALEARYGGRWSVYAWNNLSDTPRHVYGTSVQLASSVSGPAALESLARQVIAANADVLRADGSQLRLDSTPHALGKWVAHFQQTFAGIDVEGAQVRVAISDTGKLLLMGSDYHEITGLSPTPALGAAAAEALAIEALPFDPATDSVTEKPELLVLPVALSEAEVEYHLIWRLTVKTFEPFGAWQTDVDAHTGDILQRINQICFAYHGDTDVEAQVYGYCDGSTQTTMPYLTVNVSGIGSTTSNAAGDWTIAGTGGARTVTAGLSGPYVTVTNYNGAEAAFSGSALENVPFTVAFSDANARQDERDTFDAVNDIHAFFDLFDPTFGYTNAHINAYVNRTDGYCPGNAWWDGTINFCAGSTTYGNTGELQQVVHHEFGHGIQAHILGSQGNEGLGEGNSDINGNLITQDPIIGRGFYLNNCVSGIRNSVNTMQYPDDLTGSVHNDGQIIAGFNWDAMELLQDLYGGGSWDAAGTVMSAERWHFGRVLMHPFYQPDQVFATFFADDDNDNMDDGTPHHAIFCEAAMNHGYECPEVLVGVFVYHQARPYSASQNAGYPVVGQAVSLGGGAIIGGSVELTYRVNGGGFNTVLMSGTGNPDEYAGTIPAQAWGSVVEYYLEASNTLGSTGTSPVGAPAALHYFQVDDEFADAMELPTAWHLSTVAGETAGTGNWERADPQLTTAQPADDHTAAPGVLCWVTGALAGTSAGSYDVDGGSSVLYSPLFELAGASDVSVSYWRWYSNNLGNAPNEDYWTVQISNDGGASWTNVEYTTASSNAWVNIVFDLDTYFLEPGTVQLRFIAADNGGGSLVEALVDDFLLMGSFDLSGVDDGVSAHFVTRLDQNSPNPFNPKTEIRFSLSQAGQASLRIFDAQGRQVKSLVEGNLAAGPQTIVWDGTDSEGQRAASGVYFYRLETAEQTVSKRMVLLK
jgi:Zn-dependent metalloprotease